MATTKQTTSDPALPKVEQAASQIMDNIDHLTFLSELPTGERTYRIVHANRKKVTTVTISPDLATATIEWTRGKPEHGTAYRTFKIQNLIV